MAVFTTETKHITVVCSICGHDVEKKVASYTSRSGVVVQDVVTYRCTECGFEWLPGAEDDRIDREIKDARAAHPSISAQIELAYDAWVNECNEKGHMVNTRFAWRNAYRAGRESAAIEIQNLKTEIEVLRGYGNKDCLAQADEVLEKMRGANAEAK